MKRFDGYREVSGLLSEERFLMSIGESIQHIREGTKVTQFALAQQVDLSVEELRSIEHGETLPSTGLVFKASNALGVSVVQLTSHAVSLALGRPIVSFELEVDLPNEGYGVLERIEHVQNALNNPQYWETISGVTQLFLDNSDEGVG